MTREEALSRGRARALQHMPSRVRVLRSAGRAPLDRATGRQPAQYRVVYRDHPFRARGSQSGASITRTEQVGESDLQVAVRVGVMPYDTILLARDLILVDFGEHVGAVWEVLDGDPADGQTSLRVPITSSHLDDDWQEVEG